MFVLCKYLEVNTILNVLKITHILVRMRIYERKEPKNNNDGKVISTKQ